MMMVTQLINLFLVMLVIAAPVAVVIYVVANLRGNKGTGGNLMLQKLDDESYVRVPLDDVEKVDILNEYEAVIHLSEDQKLLVKPDEARRVVRKLR